MEIEAKLTAVHVPLAIVAGYLSFLLSSGVISAVGKNEVLGVLVGLIVLYISGQLSERIFGKEAVGGLKGWLWSGIVPFVFIWFVTWVLFFNH